jgi:hypothetical protein
MNNISLKDDQQSIYFSNGCVELEFSKENGRWCSLREVSTDKIILSGGEHLSSVYLTYGGHPTSSPIYSNNDVMHAGRAKLSGERVSFFRLCRKPMLLTSSIFDIIDPP